MLHAAHMNHQHAQRSRKLMLAIRQSPNFGVRLMAELPAAARAEAVRRWSSEAPAEQTRPGLKKCGPAGAMQSFSNAQLAAFARSIGRVG
jgi:hypothetical protein